MVVQHYVLANVYDFQFHPQNLYRDHLFSIQYHSDEDGCFPTIPTLFLLLFNGLIIFSQTVISYLRLLQPVPPFPFQLLLIISLFQWHILMIHQQMDYFLHHIPHPYNTNPFLIVFYPPPPILVLYNRGHLYTLEVDDHCLYIISPLSRLFTIFVNSSHCPNILLQIDHLLYPYVQMMIYPNQKYWSQMLLVYMKYHRPQSMHSLMESQELGTMEY